MNPRTGDVRRFPTDVAARLAGFTIPVNKEPKPNCCRCYGRGFIGTNDTGMKVPCVCTLVGPAQVVADSLLARAYAVPKEADNEQPR